MDLVVAFAADRQTAVRVEPRQRALRSPNGSGPKAVSRSAVVDVPAEAIFSRLVDPHHHHEVDGSGTVGKGISGPNHLRQSDSFTVSMKQFGVPYRIKSTVTRLTENREIEWWHPAGHTWRWELEPLANGQTQVTETWDFANSNATLMYRLLGVPKRNTAGIESTLRGLPVAILKS